MSIKSTRRIKREQTLSILDEISKLPNGLLGDLLDVIADSDRSYYLSKFDNFIVSEFTDEGEDW